MKVALVTGASRGIGEAILRKFVSEGIYVIGTYNSSPDKAQTIIKELGESKVEFHSFQQGNLDSHNALIQSIDKPIDILVNNAGLGSKTVESVSSNKFEQDLALMKVNALGPLWLCEAIIPKMIERKQGKVINMSSVGGGVFHFPGFRHADGMSKSAVSFMTKQMAAELAQENVDIFALCPGATETDMFNASTLEQLNEEEKQSFVANLPKKRLIQPQEIAELCYFLTKEESQLLHGAVIDSSLGLGTNPALIG